MVCGDRLGGSDVTLGQTADRYTLALHALSQCNDEALLIIQRHNNGRTVERLAGTVRGNGKALERAKSRCVSYPFGDDVMLIV